VKVTDFTIAVPGALCVKLDGGIFPRAVAVIHHGFQVRLAILSVSGVDDDGDLGDDDQAEVETVRSAMRRSQKVLLAVDSSKFGHRGLVNLGSLSGRRFSGI